MTPVQSNYERYAQLGYPGDLARPEEPHAFHEGVFHVSSGSTRPRPGYAVYYNESENAFSLPGAAHLNLVCGVASFDPGLVAGRGSIPSGANSDSFIEFSDGDPAKVGVFGSFWGIAGEDMEYGDRLTFGTSPSSKWAVQDDPAAERNIRSDRDPGSSGGQQSQGQCHLLYQRRTGLIGPVSELFASAMRLYREQWNRNDQGRIREGLLICLIFLDETQKTIHTSGFYRRPVCGIDTNRVSQSSVAG